MRKGLLSLLLVLSPTAASATAVALDLGAYGSNLSQRFAAPPGFGGEVSQIAGFLRVRPKMILSQSLWFEPSIALLVPWRSGSDGFTKMITSVWGFDFAFKWGWLKWRVGPSAQWNLTLSTAEALSLPNGTSTSTFFTPGGSSSSLLFLVETGLEFEISKSVSVGFEVWFSEVANSLRRRTHAAAYLGVSL